MILDRRRPADEARALLRSGAATRSDSARCGTCRSFISVWGGSPSSPVSGPMPDRVRGGPVVGRGSRDPLGCSRHPRTCGDHRGPPERSRTRPNALGRWRSGHRGRTRRHRDAMASRSARSATRAGGSRDDALAPLAALWPALTSTNQLAVHRSLGLTLTRLLMCTGEIERAQAIADQFRRTAATNRTASLQAAALHCEGLVNDDVDALVAAVDLGRTSPRQIELAAICLDARRAAHKRVRQRRGRLAPRSTQPLRTRRRRLGCRASRRCVAQPRCPTRRSGAAPPSPGRLERGRPTPSEPSPGSSPRDAAIGRSPADCSSLDEPSNRMSPMRCANSEWVRVSSSPVRSFVGVNRPGARQHVREHTQQS